MEHLSLNWRKCSEAASAFSTWCAIGPKRTWPDSFLFMGNCKTASNFASTTSQTRAAQIRSRPRPAFAADFDYAAVTARHPILETRSRRRYRQPAPRPVARNAMIKQSVTAVWRMIKLSLRTALVFDFFTVRCSSRTPKPKLGIASIFRPSRRLDRRSLFPRSMSMDAPDFVPVATAVAAETRFPAGQSEIRLKIDVPRFDFESYCVTPYMLFHEMCCHAFQSLRGSPRFAREDDPFAEGWMDWVTYRIFCEVAGGNGLSDMNVAECEVMREHPHSVAERTTVFRTHRYDLDNAAYGNKWVLKRCIANFFMGQKAAMAFLDLLQRTFTQIEAESLFLRASFDWNLQGSTSERMRFVDWCNRPRQLGSVPADVINGLRRYRDTGNLGALAW